METDEPKKSTPKSVANKPAEAESAPNQRENQWLHRFSLRWLASLLASLFDQSKEGNLKVIRILMDHLPEEERQEAIQTMIQKAIQALVVNTT